MLRRLRTSAFLAFVVGAPAAAAPPAFAQPAPLPGTPEARKQAKALFEQGADAFTKGDYDTAVDRWKRSYDLSHEPVIQQQLALAYGHLGLAKEERQALQNYRPFAPPEERPIIDQQIANLDARIAKQDEEDRKKAEEDARLRAAYDASRNAPRRPRVSIPGIAVGSAGVAAVIAGVVVDGVAAGARPDASQVCKADGSSQLCLASARDDIDKSNTLALAGDVTWIVGSVAVAAGVVIILVDRPRAARVETVPPAAPAAPGQPAQPGAPATQPYAPAPAPHALGPEPDEGGRAALDLEPLVTSDFAGRAAPGLALGGAF